MLEGGGCRTEKVVKSASSLSLTTGAADQSADGILAVAMCVPDQHWESIIQHRYTQYMHMPDLH